MARERDPLVNFERMREEMGELFGEAWGRGWRRASQPGFSPRVDVYYCGEDVPKAVVQVELPGVNLDTVDLEIVGRQLVISGERPVRETEGRVFQQVEIQAGPFRRVIPLNADVAAEQARADYEDGILRIELPLERSRPTSRRVPID
jgi:HSP20 family protein